MRVLPILFNTDMVRAILDGRKMVTRRLVKPQPEKEMIHKLGLCVDGDKRDVGKFGFGSHESGGRILYTKPPYQSGDILYVRETWFYEMHLHDKAAGDPDLSSGRYSHRYVYKADSPDYPVGIGVGATGWRPSIHMPKEAARIWLKVTDVRVERLQDITPLGILAEGIRVSVENEFDSEMSEEAMREFAFMTVWNSTIKKSDLDRYGWEENPWVWVIEFERCDRPEGWPG